MVRVSNGLEGYVIEGTKDNLEDYVMAGIEKKFMNDEIKVGVSGGVEIKDIEDITENVEDMKENCGTAIVPEASYMPTDNIKLVVGAFLLDGKPGTLFGGWKDQDQIYVKTEVCF